MIGNTATPFQELLLEGMCDRAALPAALDWLNAHCGSETAQIIVIGSASRVLDSAIVGTFDPDIFRKEEEYLPINPRANAVSTLDIAGTIQDFDFIDDDAVLLDATYQELLIPAGVGRFAATLLSRSANELMLLGIARPFDAGAFDEQTMLRFCETARCAIPVVELSKQIVTTRASSMLDTLGPNACAAIVEKNAKLVDFTGAFEELLSAGILTRTRAGLLDLMSPGANKQLAKCLSDYPLGVGGRFTLTPHLPEHAYVCTIAPVPPIGIFGARAGHAVLFLERLSAPPRLDRQRLMEAFSLSEEECELCEHLFSGGTVNEIAVSRNITPDHANFLVRQTLLKTRTRKLSDLIGLLSDFTFSPEKWRPYGPAAQS